jgi:hypothetical protein
MMLTACVNSSPAPSTSSSAAPFNSEGILAGEPIRIDLGVEMSPDNRVVTLRFVGGPILPATDPCNTDYAGWAKAKGDVLNVGVVLLPNPFDLATDAACAAAGFERFVQVELDEPFTGSVADDVAFGSEIAIQRP